ncbi:DUF3489 domain-containing protein [Ancylobacter sp. VNQ12]|uniref:DUF3489 domain-containing protein n=1 Tax=Ancylobacter sp. VNQ12 TaxID=3400920 RepID=UPI003C01FE48
MTITKPTTPSRARIRSRVLELGTEKRRRRKQTEAAGQAVAVTPVQLPEPPVVSTPTRAAEVPTALPTPVAPTTIMPQLTKNDLVLNQLKQKDGVSISDMMEVTGWQAHSVRGFLSAVIRKKLCLTLLTEVGTDGIRRYRIDARAAA